MSTYNPFDWYWSVQDTSPGTQVWASARGQYVPLADASYVAWLAASNVATIIDTQANLFQVINAFNVDYFNDHSSFIQSVTLIGGTPVQLTNPLARVVSVTPVISAILDLPQANLFGSPPIGQPFLFNTIGRNPAWILKTFGGGSTVVSAAVETLMLWLTDNSTQTGAWTGLTLQAPTPPTADAQLLMSAATFGSDRRWFAVTPSGDISITDTGVTAYSGIVPLAKGGANTDLSGTGGASNFLRQNSVGANITVVQPAFTDISGSVAATQLPNPTASTLGGIESLASVAHKWINQISTSGVPSATQPATTDISDITSGTWTPVDVSGASLALTNVSGVYIKIGSLVWASARFDYPATGNATPAAIGGLPFTISATSGASSGFITYSNKNVFFRFTPSPGGTAALLYDSAGIQLTNAQMSSGVNIAAVIYSV